VALAQPKILLMSRDCRKTKQINSLGGDVHFLGNGLLRGGKYVRKKDAQCDHDVFFVSGTCLLIKKEFYEKTGGLDADFFMYLEDVDLSWQAQLLGYTCRVVTGSVVWHQYIFERKDPKRKKFYYLERNRLWCLYKNYTCRTLVLLFPAICIFECGIIAHSLVHHYFWYKMAAYWGCVRKLGVMHRKKVAIQKGRVCSDAEIFARMTDVIKFEAIDGKMLRVANFFFAVYYKIMKRFI
jgi:GT2 family glycosyltransferase